MFMKQRILLTLSFLSLFLASNFSQSHWFIDDFKGIKTNGKVILNWTIKKDNTCNGILILRSTDNSDFEVIGRIEGICGSSDSAQDYTFVDEEPILNKTNYYKLEFGLFGKTEPSLAIKFIDLSKTGSKVYPNPFLSETNIAFVNPNKSDHRVDIFDSTGKLVFRFVTNDDEVYVLFLTEVDQTQIIYPISTLYIYRIYDENNVLVASGQMIRQLKS